MGAPGLKSKPSILNFVFPLEGGSGLLATAKRSIGVGDLAVYFCMFKLTPTAPFGRTSPLKGEG